MTKNNEQTMVVLFGRTNVGKSTLFNCLTEKRKALVSEIEGTTRDSIIGNVSWEDKHFQLIDTGGIMDLSVLTNRKRDLRRIKEDAIDEKVQRQARQYLEKADLILFLVDAKSGILPDDKKMALALKKILPDTSNIILVVNKADSPTIRKDIAEFNKLSLGEPLAISAATGSGTGDLLDLIKKKLDNLKIGNEEIKKSEKINTINVTIIGKPNVGKSSLVNAITNEDRIIVSPIEHTTREPQDTYIEHKDKIINLIDTAGISRQGQKSAKHKRFNSALEKLSITKTIATLRRADVCLLIIDISQELTQQEAKIIDEIVKHNIGLIILANKWDLVEKKDTKAYTEKIYSKLPFIKWAPIQFTSAKTGAKVEKVLDLILEIHESRQIKVSENALSKFLHNIIKKHRPQKAKGVKQPFIYELKQEPNDAPVFSVRLRSDDSLLGAYIKYIENQLRKKFGFIGTPIKIIIKRNKKVHGRADSSSS